MPTYCVTAEHCNGKSVGHPCRKGIYDDPTDQFETFVDADSPEAAMKIARDQLRVIVGATETCECRKSKTLGNGDWWNSVAFLTEPIERK